MGTFVACVNSRADGRWDVDLWKNDSHGSTVLRPDTVAWIYGVTASRTVRTERKARKVASKMLARVRAAEAASDRGRYEVTS